jgi:hypothetical protein
LAWFGAEVDNFPTHILMGDKKHSITTPNRKKKRQQMEGHYVNCPQNKKFKAALSSGVMATVY